MAPLQTFAVLLLSLTTAVLANPLNNNNNNNNIQARADGLEECGPVVCAAGTRCCNASCGYCTAPGVPCTMEGCLGPQCGPDPYKFCALGEECCNPSCGHCAKPGQGCTEELCVTVG